MADENLEQIADRLREDGYPLYARKVLGALTEIERLRAELGDAKQAVIDLNGGNAQFVRANDRLRELLAEAADDLEEEGVSTEWTKVYRDAALDGGAVTGSVPHPWRCFHCEEVFSDRAAAREHFGVTLTGVALCQEPRDMQDALRRARDAENRWMDLAAKLGVERTENERLAHMLASWERQFATTDPREAWNRLDSMEGRALAAEERAAVPAEAAPNIAKSNDRADGAAFVHCPACGPQGTTWFGSLLRCDSCGNVILSNVSTPENRAREFPPGFHTGDQCPYRCAFYPGCMCGHQDAQRTADQPSAGQVKP